MRTMDGHVARWASIAAFLALGCEPLYPDVGAKADASDSADSAAVADASRTDAAGTDTSGTDAALADTAVADSDAAVADSGATDAAVWDAAVADAATDAAVADVAADVPDAGPDVAADAGVDAGTDAFVPMPVSATNIDVNSVNWSCTNPNWQPTACGPGTETSPPLLPGIHVDLPNAITYADLPPSSGTHRPVWGRWGSYVELPEQRWLHNLEHGGIAFLYHPCAPESTIAALQAIAHAQSADATGPFRWVLTPYPNLPSAVAIVAWGHLYEAPCVLPDEIKAFITAHYRKAPEDEPTPGGYEELWLNDWP